MEHGRTHGILTTCGEGNSYSLLGVSLPPDQENQGNACRAWKERKRKNQSACQSRKQIGQLA